jgi:hypothetical protein
MNKAHAKKIAETITNEEIHSMFVEAHKNISNWNAPSICNKGLSKGIAWNVLASDFDVNQNHHIMAKTNMIREFGEYLPKSFQPLPKLKPTSRVIHQEPDFKNYV